MAVYEFGPFAHLLGAKRSLGANGLAAVLAAAAIVGPAQAKVVMFPETNPAVTLDVPDNWTVSTSPVGLQLRSPEKNSILVANFFKGDKAAAETWPKQAGKTLEEAGVTTDNTATSEAHMAPPAESSAEPPRSLPPATPPVGEHFTFSGTPSVVDPLGIVRAGRTKTFDADGTPGMVPAGSIVRNKIPHRIVNYKGGRLDGKPTDVQLYVFSLAKNELFLIEQQSGGTDNRAVEIVYSVKAVH